MLPGWPPNWEALPDKPGGVAQCLRFAPPLLSTETALRQPWAKPRHTSAHANVAHLMLARAIVLIPVAY